MNSTMTRLTRWLAGFALLLASAACTTTAPDKTPPAQRFDTPEQAVQAMAALIGAHDPAAVDRVFGPGSVDMFASGDPDADAEDFQRVKEMIQARVAFEDLDAHTKVALLGEKEWPWPIPLVGDGKGWRFDTASGREELLNRRIGRNELQTLQALHAVVDAQEEYASEGRDGMSWSYARKFISSADRHDGLYWPPVEGESLSPLGDLLAEAAADLQSGARVPYHGYYYRILEAQGPAAPGGKGSYLDDEGRMTRGFAVIAWPAKYGNSGVMTFIVSQRDIVFQKDLGPETEDLANTIDAFDPDPAWSPTADATLLDDEEAAAE